MAAKPQSRFSKRNLRRLDMAQLEEMLRASLSSIKELRALLKMAQSRKLDQPQYRARLISDLEKRIKFQIRVSAEIMQEQERQVKARTVHVKKRRITRRIH
jgi:hypothetical protein